MAATPTGFRMQTPDNKVSVVDMQPKGNLPLLKPDDMQYFDKLLVSINDLIRTLTPLGKEWDGVSSLCHYNERKDLTPCK